MIVKHAKNIAAILCPLLMLLVLAYGYFWHDWKPTFGSQSGYLQKLSKKGFICKTWEGEMAAENGPEGEQKKFLFSIRDDEVAQQVHAGIGMPVHLEFQIHKGVTYFGCLGDTIYMVTKVVRRP